MIGILSSALLLSLALVALALQRLYSVIPARELRRLARRNDQLATMLYKTVAYGVATRLFLWLVAGIAFSAGLLIALPLMPIAAGFVFMAILMLVAFVWLPSLRLTVHTAHFAATLSPAVAWVLSYIHKPLETVAGKVNDYRDLMPHSRMYEKEDLVKLLSLQKEQVDNRIDEADLDLVQRTLSFGDRFAADIAQPRKKAHLVNADDTLGPILLDQLHQGNQNSFLVYKDKKDNIMGSLLMKDAVSAKQGGRVFDLVHHDLMYVSEDFSLRQTLTAFQQTGQQVAVVVNKFEEFVGTITLSDLLKELAGEAEPAVENYEDRTLVSQYVPKQEEQSEVVSEEVTSPEPPPESDNESPTSPDATEVVK